MNEQKIIVSSLFMLAGMGGRKKHLHARYNYKKGSFVFFLICTVITSPFCDTHRRVT